MNEHYWIKPDGGVVEAPEGHLRYIETHWQAEDLPSNISMVELVRQGWIRVSDNNIIINHIDNPEVYSSLRDLMRVLDYEYYYLFINHQLFTISKKDIEARPFVDIYKDILAGELPSVYADAFDQGVFEYQPSLLETDSDGSMGSKEKGIHYMPQDWTQEVWWSRQLLDYMKKNFPGKKWVIPPEDDQGYPTQASQVVDRLTKQADASSALKYIIEKEGPRRVTQGSWRYSKDSEGIIHIVYYSTEVITADANSRKVLHITTGGWYTMSTTKGISKCLKFSCLLIYTTTPVPALQPLLRFG